MYDRFRADVSCPLCGTYIGEEFQTKDFERLLSWYQPGMNVGGEDRIIKVYHACPHGAEFDKYEPSRDGDGGLMFWKCTSCLWIEYEIPIENGVIVIDQNRWVRRTEPLEGHMYLSGWDGTEEEAREAVKERNRRSVHNMVLVAMEQQINGGIK